MAAVEYVDYVSASAVRTAVLKAIRQQPRSTRSLVSDVDASESAVYDAVSALAERDLVTQSGDDWRETGLGAVVGELLDRQHRTEQVVSADPEYWQRHDPTVIPRRHRRFERLAGAEVLRATDTDPHGVVREVAARIREAEWVRVLAPIYHHEFADAVADTPDVRLVLDPSVVDEVVDGAPDEDDQAAFPVRIADLSFALTVTDECVLVSLPLLDGSYDVRSELVAETSAAVAWGQGVFEDVWEDGLRPAEAIDGLGT